VLSDPKPESVRSPLSNVLLNLSAIPKVRRLCVAFALRIERGQFYSHTAREILKLRYGVTIGAYSYGACFKTGQLPPGVTIGRYASIGPGVSVLLRNHPMDRLSTHPFFFNCRLGYVEADNVEFKSLWIGHDSWIGKNAIFTPGCNRVGVGAVIGAGAVVTHDVPDFAVVGGNPARVIRYRFSEEARGRVLASKWWENPINVCSRELKAMTGSLDQTLDWNPLLAHVDNFEAAGQMRSAGNDDYRDLAD
jgi:virginiamycin A acetyltransferase